MYNLFGGITAFSLEAFVVLADFRLVMLLQLQLQTLQLFEVVCVDALDPELARRRRTAHAHSQLSRKTHQEYHLLEGKYGKTTCRDT